jgi:hypothetical protein
VIGPVKPPLDELAHYGVKGMRWGQRKKYSSADIKNARAGQNSRLRQLQRAEDDLNTVASNPRATTAQEKRAVRNFQKLEKDYEGDPQRAIAARMTRGEKIATVILTGPLAVVPLGVNAATVRSIEKSQQKNG